jgi:hypothetical protein
VDVRAQMTTLRCGGVPRAVGGPLCRHLLTGQTGVFTDCPAEWTIPPEHWAQRRDPRNDRMIHGGTEPLGHLPVLSRKKESTQPAMTVEKRTCRNCAQETVTSPGSSQDHTEDCTRTARAGERALENESGNLDSIWLYCTYQAHGLWPSAFRDPLE